MQIFIASVRIPISVIPIEIKALRAERRAIIVLYNTFANYTKLAED